MNDTRPRQTEISIFINTVLLSVDQHRQLLRAIAEDIEERQEDLEAADYLDIGWKLGTIDSYFSNLDGILSLCSADRAEEVPSFNGSGRRSPTERIEELIDYLEKVEEVLNQMATTRLETISMMDELSDAQIREWMAR